ncbi:Filamin-B [Pseudolycoriella hygida]|uniref:Filamin-B n=1 Tax=Pseudolycoriella hygida TaxID=35572 RepID=A0A9Q0S8J0_9DIPT|nr:Filamin-B [Pseudolycoriella hygida]
MSANRIQAWGEGLSQGYAGQPSKFVLHPSGLSLSGITLAVEGPTHPEFFVDYPRGGLIEVSYVPTFPGLYKIHIKFFGRDIPGSPFPVEIFGDTQSKQEMVRDVIENVKISGSAASYGKALITNQFLLDPRNAIVSGGLSAYMQGPGHIDVDFKENLDGTIHVQYKPLLSGTYKLNVKFGDIPVQGSPFTIHVN